MRLRQRGLAAGALRAAVASLEIIEAYPDDKYLPSFLLRVRIPSDADQRSDLMPIAIPISCRSPFQSDGDHRSNLMPITFRLG
jgi:hypothetical protein